ncbi:hypothetical protein DSC45_28950 [Streptomyces sp. YIM 130001]|nr:hypothetical protein DSC45_28950 [Streptomyces sp. YIM 130001]
MPRAGPRRPRTRSSHPDGPAASSAGPSDVVSGTAPVIGGRHAVGRRPSPAKPGTAMPTGQHHPTVRPATGEDLGDLQALARRTIGTCYRGFLGDEAADWFIGSGASDAHVRTHLAQGGVYGLTQIGPDHRLLRPRRRRGRSDDGRPGAPPPRGGPRPAPAGTRDAPRPVSDRPPRDLPGQHEGHGVLRGLRMGSRGPPRRRGPRRRRVHQDRRTADRLDRVRLQMQREFHDQ